MRVTLINHMGSDLDVVNDARVSFDKESDWDYSSCPDPDGMPPEIVKEYRELPKADKSLINFLARGCTSSDWEGILSKAIDMGESDDIDSLEELLNHVRRIPKHWVPFANGGTIKMRFKVPIFVARQLQKHQAGFEPQSEISRRYVTTEPEFYEPEVWRKAADNVKQGSSDEPASDVELTTPWQRFGYQLSTYKELLEAGVCPEQARMVLPQSMYTEYVWKGNLYAWASLYNTRSGSHAQREVQEVARQIGEIIEPLFPVSWKELTR